MLQRYNLAGELYLFDCLVTSAGYKLPCVDKCFAGFEQAHGIGQHAGSHHITGNKQGVGICIRATGKKFFEIIFGLPEIFAGQESLPAFCHSVYSKSNCTYRTCISYRKKVFAYSFRIKYYYLHDLVIFFAKVHHFNVSDKSISRIARRFAPSDHMRRYCGTLFQCIILQANKHSYYTFVAFSLT